MLKDLKGEPVAIYCSLWDTLSVTQALNVKAPTLLLGKCGAQS